MKKINLGISAFLLIIGLNGCGAAPEDMLKNSIEKYKECTINRDSKCIASYTDPSLVELSGGIDEFAANLQKDLDKTKSKMKISMRINNIGKIKKNAKTLQANITITQTMEILDEQMKEMMGEKIEQKETTIAISNDNGETWFFTNKASQELVKELKELKNIK